MAQVVSPNAHYLQGLPKRTRSWPLNMGPLGRALTPSNLQWARESYLLALTPFRYHSHFSAQYGNGVLGSIVIHGPASANYDIDLGPFPISDWYYSGVDALLTRVNDPNNPFVPGFPGAPPNADNLLFNGSNVNPQGPGGTYAQVTLTPGKLHLLRLINPSVENTYTVSLVGHSFTVIATDLVPVQPTTVTSLFMAVGQRYDVIINASQPVASYWFNATSSSGPCGVVNNPSPAAIFSYSGSTAAIPTNPGTAPSDSFCADSLTYTPVVPRTAPVASFTPSISDTLNTNLQIGTADGVARVFWPVNSSPMNVTWEDPTLQYVATGSVASMAPAENVISLPSANTVKFLGQTAAGPAGIANLALQMTFWLIQNNSSIPVSWSTWIRGSSRSRVAVLTRLDSIPFTFT